MGKFRYRADGDTAAEKRYATFRYHCGKIAKRVRENPRCRKCFTLGSVRGAWKIKHGCDGCSEMEDFFHATQHVSDHEATADAGRAK